MTQHFLYQGFTGYKSYCMNILKNDSFSFSRQKSLFGAFYRKMFRRKCRRNFRVKIVDLECKSLSS